MTRLGSFAHTFPILGLFSLVLAACGAAPASGSGSPDDAPAADGGTDDTGAAPEKPTDGGGPKVSAPPTPTPDAPADGAASSSPPPAPTRTVLLIPGTAITGDYFDSMAARLRADGFDPVVYEAPDLLTGGLADGASKLPDVVDARLRATGETRLHVVAECNGGVATRYWLQVLGGHAKVDQVVTFVSAHHGTWESPIGSWASGFQSLKDITPGSDFLAKLNAAPYPPSLHLTSIYSCNDELMVPYTTSVVPGATNVLFCDHALGHLDGFWDALVYERILATLRGKGDAAPTRY